LGTEVQRFLVVRSHAKLPLSKKENPQFKFGLLPHFLLKHTKTWKNIPNYHKIYQMVTKYTNIVVKVPYNIRKLGFLGLKIDHLATLIEIGALNQNC
jgi:hypothetical protein